MRALALLALLSVPGSSAGPDGLTHSAFKHGGRERTAWVVAPKGKAKGVLLFLSGRQGLAKMRAITRGELERRAVADGFVVVYPEAVEFIYNDGRAFPKFPSQAQDIDDAGFIWAAAERLAREHGAEGGPVYAVGFAAGGLMVQRLVCENDGRLKGAVSVAGTLARPLARACAGAHPVPVMLVAGDDDPFNDWKKGLVHIFNIEQGRILSPERTLALWGKTFRCGEAKSRLLTDADAEDGTRTLLTERHGCRGGARLRLYTVRGGGLGWPGGDPVELEAVVGVAGNDFDASKAAWDFLRGR
ncbi:MAG: hypothetical protein HY928_11975 [Elusimicrobia bacterium]|nr:hypothetical protein [Elusimicrobiota bacterium]